MAVPLSAIKTGVRLQAPKGVLYGVGGIGKTTWAAGAHKPIFIFAEDGQGSLDVARFEFDEGPVVRTWQQIVDCVEALYLNEHDYGTVVLDTIDMAEPLLWQHTAAKHDKPDIEAFGYGKGYAYAVDEARVLFDGLEALRNEKKMAVVILAHAETKRYESPDAEPYDRYKFALQDRLAKYLHNWSDFVLFANYRTHVVKDEDKSRKKTTTRGVGTGERIIYTSERPAFWAKNRYGLPPELEMAWRAFQDGIVRPEEPEPETETKKKKE